LKYRFAEYGIPVCPDPLGVSFGLGKCCVSGNVSLLPVLPCSILLTLKALVGGFLFVIVMNNGWVCSRSPKKFSEAQLLKEMKLRRMLRDEEWSLYNEQSDPAVPSQR
jgi:hypothetical protein